jgi:hypothetical protein
VSEGPGSGPMSAPEWEFVTQSASPPPPVPCPGNFFVRKRRIRVFGEVLGPDICERIVQKNPLCVRVCDLLGQPAFMPQSLTIASRSAFPSSHPIYPNCTNCAIANAAIDGLTLSYSGIDSNGNHRWVHGSGCTLTNGSRCKTIVLTVPPVGASNCVARAFIAVQNNPGEDYYTLVNDSIVFIQSVEPFVGEMAWGAGWPNPTPGPVAFAFLE